MSEEYSQMESKGEFATVQEEDEEEEEGHVAADTRCFSRNPEPDAKTMSTSRSKSRQVVVAVPSRAGGQARRTRIPNRPDVSMSLWGIIKNAIGKDLTKLPLPVNFNEPLSMLQRLVEDFEYSSILDAAAGASDSIDQLCLVAAFTVSSYASTAVSHFIVHEYILKFEKFSIFEYNALNTICYLGTDRKAFQSFTGRDVRMRSDGRLRLALRGRASEPSSSHCSSALHESSVDPLARVYNELSVYWEFHRSNSFRYCSSPFSWVRYWEKNHAEHYRQVLTIPVEYRYSPEERKRLYIFKLQEITTHGGKLQALYTT
jgi:hypothetical protein